MSFKGKEEFIERTGGFRFGETPAMFQARVAKIDALTADLKEDRAGQHGGIDALVQKISRLKGEPDVEWDYEPND